MKEEIVVALVGNPNVGKTAIMNALAGTKAKVGNWPGVTVEKKEGFFSFRGFKIKLIDLPGVYSLTSYTIEERVTRNFLLNEKYDTVLNVVDVTTLGRNLYLTLELLEMGVKPILALNKVDDVEDFNINFEKLSKILNLPVVPVSAYTGAGLSELKEKMVLVALEGIKGKVFQPVYSEIVEAAILEVSSVIKSLFEPQKVRWYAIKILEGDKEIIEKVLSSSSGEKLKSVLERIRKEVKERKGEDIGAIIVRERFIIASEIAKEVVEAEKKCEKECLRDRIDRVITTPLTGIPVFFAIMAAVFKLTFMLSEPFVEIIGKFFGDILPSFLYKLPFPEILKSFIDRGVFAGVGSVLSFLPILFVLYTLLSILEDSGYMARAAALWDNFMRIFGLSGASVIPLILGFGCNVPAVYSTRAMRSPIQKLITMLVIPWISCSARLAVYTVFIAAFFESSRTLIVLSLYGTGIFIALIFSKLLSLFLKSSGEEEFFIELPAYKVPSLKMVLNQTFIEVKDFIEKAGTVIFLASVIIWVLASFPFGVEYAGEHSLAGMIGKLILPVFKPIGITDWKPVIALLFGGVAKEVVVGTLGTLYGNAEHLPEVLRTVFTPQAALAYLFFVLLYIPCIATISAIYQESGSKKWVLFVVAVELAVAWVVAFIVYHIALVVSL
ncbi:ferrous iron transport protein B [Desulfurobacterium atlanticum]|uniref:Ferrous iron transport protein B n=1 Tax=Desulfurobacterium atlanticum TaxID=240169 RepID=A0A238Y7M1_9BACT|nr:ferrous iron transport protein B [Desulfurobacterium atlanticum]SNR67276.1 ferrous iron transport protein B [Desulfurobacterium atlanticum]